MTNLFETINLIYTSKDYSFVNYIDSNVSPVVINLMLSRYYKISHHVQVLNKFPYCLDAKQYSLMAWGLIHPKLSKAPFVKKIAVNEEDVNRYEFLLKKIRERFEIGDNDWRDCKDMFLEHVKKNLKLYLVFYGCSKKEWSIVGLDFEESKKMNITEVKEGLSKWC